MRQVITATVENGFLKPDQPLTWPAGTRLKLSLEPITPEETADDAAWEELERMWAGHSYHSGGVKLTRDQLHERR